MKAIGFTLIELVIGLFLSSIISLALYNSFFITNRVVDIADNFIITDFRSIIIENQLSKDLSGIFVPVEPETSTTTTQAQEKEKKEQSPQQEEKPKSIEKIFYSSPTPEGSLNVLTFITNNPIKIYEKATNTKPKPRIVRVVYRLLPQENNPQSYKLMRQESTNLDFKAFELTSAKPIRAYELAYGIKSFKIEYMFPALSQKEAPKTSPITKSKKTAPQKEEKPEYKTSNNWDVSTKKDVQEQPKIPQFITITCELWDAKQQRTTSITFKYEILTFVANTMPKPEKKSPLLKALEADIKATVTPAATTPVTQARVENRGTQ